MRLLLAPKDVMETVPLYVPGAKLYGCTETPRLAGVNPPVLSIESHLPPDETETDAAKLVVPAEIESI